MYLDKMTKPKAVWVGIKTDFFGWISKPISRSILWYWQYFQRMTHLRLLGDKNHQYRKLTYDL